MKGLISYISFALVLLIVMGLGWQSYTVVHFYANQDEIEEAYCINKDKPELNCHGQCHLSDQLESPVVKKSSTDASVQITALIVFQLFEDLSMSTYKLDKEETSIYSNYTYSIQEDERCRILDRPEIS